MFVIITVSIAAELPDHIIFYCENCLVLPTHVQLSHPKCEKCHKLLMIDCNKCNVRRIPYKCITDHLGNAECSEPKRVQRNDKQSSVKFSKPCKKCGRVFRRHCALALARHKERCGTADPVYCSLCPFMTKCKFKLKSHMQKHALSSERVNTTHMVDIGKFQLKNYFTLIYGNN